MDETQCSQSHQVTAGSDVAPTRNLQLQDECSGSETLLRLEKKKKKEEELRGRNIKMEVLQKRDI